MATFITCQLVSFILRSHLHRGCPQELGPNRHHKLVLTFQFSPSKSQCVINFSSLKSFMDDPLAEERAETQHRIPNLTPPSVCYDTANFKYLRPAAHYYAQQAQTTLKWRRARRWYGGAAAAVVFSKRCKHFVHHIEVERNAS